MLNSRADRPMSPFEEKSGYSTRATTPDTAGSRYMEQDTDDEDADEHLREAELHERISDFLTEAMQPVTEDLVDFVRDEINEKHAEQIRKWSFRTHI